MSLHQAGSNTQGGTLGSQRQPAVSLLRSGGIDRFTGVGGDTQSVSSDNAAPVPCLFCASHRDCPLAQLNQAQPPATSVALLHVYPLETGQHLYHAGNKLRLLHIVKSGSLKGYITDKQGREQVVGFYLPGDIVGVDALNTRRHTSSAVALESTAACTVPVQQVERLARRCSPDWLNKLLGVELQRRQRALLMMGRKTAESRLAAFLVDMATRLKACGHSGRSLKLSMARQDIGDYLGLTMETISRTLTRLQTSGVLQVHRRRVLIRNFQNLYALADMQFEHARGARSPYDV